MASADQPSAERQGSSASRPAAGDGRLRIWVVSALVFTLFWWFFLPQYRFSINAAMYGGNPFEPWVEPDHNGLYVDTCFPSRARIVLANLAYSYPRIGKVPFYLVMLTNFAVGWLLFLFGVLLQWRSYDVAIRRPRGAAMVVGSLAMIAFWSILLLNGADYLVLAAVWGRKGEWAVLAWAMACAASGASGLCLGVSRLFNLDVCMHKVLARSLVPIGIVAATPLFIQVFAFDYTAHFVPFRGWSIQDRTHPEYVIRGRIENYGDYFCRSSHLICPGSTAMSWEVTFEGGCRHGRVFLGMIDLPAEGWTWPESEHPFRPDLDPDHGGSPPDRVAEYYVYRVRTAAGGKPEIEEWREIVPVVRSQYVIASDFTLYYRYAGDHPSGKKIGEPDFEKFGPMIRSYARRCSCWDP